MSRVWFLSDFFPQNPFFLLEKASIFSSMKYLKTLWNAVCSLSIAAFSKWKTNHKYLTCVENFSPCIQSVKLPFHIFFLLYPQHFQINNMSNKILPLWLEIILILITHCILDLYSFPNPPKKKCNLKYAYLGFWDDFNSSTLIEGDWWQRLKNIF